ncbi:MAG TPA: tRNA pseudouridine(55) synthase TruB [Vicinamibacterales bacterium]|nr:tRNA pseudouridine(55) synthase TruB [Vicinamibacterales bacterium]
MDGVLLIDKPAGPTSHDVVARVRRTSGERQIGHTGTLDPAATGLLLLVVGRATRLASWLTGRDKSYEATIRLGWFTDTDDADGVPTGPPDDRRPSDEQLADALAPMRGAFEQLPPRHSAKKIQGRRAYDLARRQQDVPLVPAPVVVGALEVTGRDADTVSIRLTASAGFYVRALARDLGARLGCGAHLLALRRTRSGTFDVADAIELAEAERLGPAIAAKILPPADALPDLVAVELTPVGLTRAVHGNPVGPEHLSSRWLPPATTAGAVRLLGPDGRLVALARSRGGALHPAVVLG